MTRPNTTHSANVIAPKVAHAFPTSLQFSMVLLPRPVVRRDDSHNDESAEPVPRQHRRKSLSRRSFVPGAGRFIGVPRPQPGRHCPSSRRARRRWCKLSAMLRRRRGKWFTVTLLVAALAGLVGHICAVPLHAHAIPIEGHGSHDDDAAEHSVHTASCEAAKGGTSVHVLVPPSQLTELDLFAPSPR